MSVVKSIVLSLLGLLILLLIVVSSLKPQETQWHVGQATGSFKVTRSAVLLPGSCVEAAWSVSGAMSVKLLDLPVSNSAETTLCIVPNHSPTLRFECLCHHCWSIFLGLLGWCCSDLHTS